MDNTTICVYCGKKFKKYNKRQKTCGSKECTKLDSKFRMRKIIETRKKEGLCVQCGKRPSNIGARCDVCCDKYNKANLERQQKLRSQKLCIQCKKPLIGKGKRCPECAMKANKQQKIKNNICRNNNKNKEIKHCDIKGINWNKLYQKWEVKFQKNHKIYFVGYYNDLEEAKQKLEQAKNNILSSV